MPYNAKRIGLMSIIVYFIGVLYFLCLFVARLHGNSREPYSGDLEYHSLRFWGSDFILLLCLCAAAGPGGGVCG